MLSIIVKLSFHHVVKIRNIGIR